VSALQQDVIGTVCVGCSYITYNGIPTIRNKTKLALQQGSGVMIWELSQDAPGANSLLAAISSEIGGTPSSSSSSAAVSKSSSSTSVSSIKSSSSSSSTVATGQQCNWWGTYYALCQTSTGNWGWENNNDCISASLCATLSPPYGIVGTASSVSTSKSSASSVSSKSSSSSLSSKSSSSSSSSKSSSSSLADTVAPSVPGNLRSTDQSDSTVTLAWDPSTDNLGVASYIVTYSFGTKTLTVTTTTASITGLSANTAYTFYVKAKDAAGNTSGDSPNLVVTTKPTSEVVKATGVPGAPHLSHNNWSSESTYNLHMTMWYGNNGSKWEIYENGNLFYSANITDNSPNQQDASFDVTGKSNGTYSYYAKLINKFGTSTSDTITVTVTKGGAGDTTAPTVPQSFALTGKTSTSVSLSWTAATDNLAVTGYVISGGPAAVNVTGTTVTITGLTASTAYNFTVKAKDAAGNLSAASSVVNVTTSPNVVDTTPPTAPASLASTAVTSASVSLSWGAATDNIGVAGYVIYYGTSSVNVTGTAATVSNLASNTNYTFTVKAIDGSGNLSATSNAVTVKTSPFNGVEPAQLLFDDFTYATPDDASFLLNWKASDYGPAAPGVGVFSKNNVVFMADPTNSSNKQMRIMFKASGSRETTIQGEVEGKKQFLYGTYATRMRFFNQPIEGPSQVVGPDTGDRMIETFFTISPYYVPNTEYGELDFEYLPNAGWNADEGGRFTGPTMWNTTWKNRDTRITKPTADDFSGWHTFWMTVTPTAVTYYIDDRMMVQHTNVDYIPKTTMYLMYNIWISGEMFAAGQNGIARTWAGDVDWMYYAKDTTLTRPDVESFVNQYRSQNIPKKDTLPAPN
jgi:chitodextrinase